MGRKYLVMLVLFLLLLTVPLVIGSCAEKAEKPTQIVKDVTAQEAFALIKENQGNPDFIIVDVRTPEEFADGHIENAVNIDFRSKGFKDKVVKLDKDKTYLIHCRSGNRSRGALDVMTELGFTEVYHLSAGIIGWQGAGLPIAK